MARGQRGNPAKQGRGRKRRPPLAAHRLFAPILGLWGALLGASVTLVLPLPMTLSAAARIGLGPLGTLGPAVLALLAALVLGAAMLALAGTLSRRVVRHTDTPSLAARAMRHVRTIDPARELGSVSLDEPVDSMPFASRPPQDETRTGSDPVDATAEAPDDLPPPQALDLAAFAELPGRNGVWVEEPSAEAAQSEAVPVIPVAEHGAPEEAAAPGPLPRPANPGAIAKLRAVPPSELSMIQMVERFAAALHEHQAAAARSGQRPDPAGRDAALAEALKALGALSGEMRADAGGEHLREALTRLQELRGAA